MRSRDDNLILLCANLILNILNKCSSQSIESMDIYNKGSTSILVCKSIINLFVLEPPFRPATIKTLYILLHKIISISQITHDDINEQDIHKLKSGFFRNIANLQKMMEYPKLSKYVLELFEKEVSEHDRIGMFSIDASNMYYMLCPIPEPGQKNVPFDLSSISVEKDIVKREILIFMLYTGIFHSLYPAYNKLDISSRLKPLNEDINTMQGGDNYNIYDKTQHVCYFKTLTTSKPVFIIEDPKLFIIVERKTESLGIIKFIEQLKYVDLMIDNSNPRALVISSKNKVDILLYRLMI